MIKTRKTYNSCAELPLFNFIKLVVTNETEWIYSEPKSVLKKEVDTQALWETIFEEYSRLSNNTKNKQILSLLKEITTINVKLDLVDAICVFLSDTFDADLVQILKNMGFRYRYTEETIAKDIQLTLSSAKRMIFTRDEAMREYEIANKQEDPLTEKDFNKLVIQLSKFIGFSIDTKKASTLDFINYVEAFNEEYKKNG